jgi:hypothetical protein
MPVTTAHFQEQVAALEAQTQANIDARIAAGEQAEMVTASELSALKRAVTDLVAASAAEGVQEAAGDWSDDPVDAKTGAAALAAMWLLRNWRYYRAGGVPGLLLGGLTQAGAHTPKPDKKSAA